MRVAIDALDVSIGDDVLDAVDAVVMERTGSSSFADARDLRLRFRRTKDALLVCVAAVGFAGGSLVTSRGKSASPIEAMVAALDELPASIDRSANLEAHRRAVAQPRAAVLATGHAAQRETLRKLLG